LQKKYIVRLSAEERGELEAMVTRGKGVAYKIKHANILLAADVGGPAWPDQQIAEAFSCHPRTVENVRRRLVLEGLAAALERQKQAHPSNPPKLDGKGQARLTALACSQPPEGRDRWTLQLLADRLVELEVVDSISGQTVRRTLKKNDLRPHLQECWVIPPEADAEFVACMEDVLDVYERPYDPKCPVVNMDEQPVQLVKEVRQPLATQPGRPRRYDHEYERAGTACVFLFTEALAGWREVKVRSQRTAVDWAQEVAALLEGRYAQAEKIILICDQLNTHTVASLYKAFPPETARRLAQRLEIHYTPKHGSWLNLAECELSVLTRHCLRNRTPSLRALARKVTVWTRDRNARQRGVDWQFATKDARIKLKRLYPQVQLS